MGTFLMEEKGFHGRSCLLLSLKSFFVLPIVMLICINSLHPVTAKTLWDNDESNRNISDVKQTLPMVSIGGHQFLVEQQYFEQPKEQRKAFSGLKDVMYNEDTAFHHNLHLRYLMSSTAEQPDNSGRSSAFNIWLTILIAALAAAILS